MNTQRKVEIFSAGCPACESVIELVQKIACSNCEVTVLDMKKPEDAQRAKTLGVNSVPAVAINGKLADCCSQNGVSEKTLRAAGLGSK